MGLFTWQGNNTLRLDNSSATNSVVIFTNSYSYSGLTWVRQGTALILSNTTGYVVPGDLTIGDSSTITPT